MKLKHIAFLFGLLVPAMAQAQNYSLEWSAISGSAGTGSSGEYSVAATVGQPAAGGTTAKGNYDLAAGFWEVPGGPGLTIQFTAPNTIVISWPVPELGCFVLQEAATLNPPSGWTDVPATVTYANGVDHVTVTLTGQKEYYRLVSPCQ